MSEPSDDGVLALPSRLTMGEVPALFERYASQLAAIRRLDFSSVNAMDSAGVAWIHWFRSQQHALGLTPAVIDGDSVGRFQVLSRAHRLENME